MNHGLYNVLQCCRILVGVLDQEFLHNQSYRNQKAHGVFIHDLRPLEYEHGVNHAFEIQQYTHVQLVYQTMFFRNFIKKIS